MRVTSLPPLDEVFVDTAANNVEISENRTSFSLDLTFFTKTADGTHFQACDVEWGTLATCSPNLVVQGCQFQLQWHRAETMPNAESWFTGPPVEFDRICRQMVS